MIIVGLVMLYVDLFFFFFFFQAEDGIRDLTVTGVQTCALPIYAGMIKPQAAFFEQSGPSALAVLQSLLLEAKELGFVTILDARSEERRVGKECRYRWAR